MFLIIICLALALMVLMGVFADSCYAQDLKDRGITVYKPDKFYNGYTLFCHSYENPRTDSEDGLGHIYLIDMEGNVAHEWTTKTAQQGFLRLLPNGNLYYPTRDRSNINQAGLREIDPDSKVVWYYHCRIDHDYYILDNGNLMIHCITDRMAPHIGPELLPNGNILICEGGPCRIFEVTPDKEIVWEFRSPFKKKGALSTYRARRYSPEFVKPLLER